MQSIKNIIKIHFSVVTHNFKYSDLICVKNYLMSKHLFFILYSKLFFLMQLLIIQNLKLQYDNNVLQIHFKLQLATYTNILL